MWGYSGGVCGRQLMGTPSLKVFEVFKNTFIESLGELDQN